MVEDYETKRALLASSLELAVPLWIVELQGHEWEYLRERAEICAQYIAEKGDIILYKSKKKGETAQAFNRLAEGVAILSFAPGGVKLFGCHFENELLPRTNQNPPEAVKRLAEIVQIVDAVQNEQDQYFALKRIREVADYKEEQEPDADNG